MYGRRDRACPVPTSVLFFSMNLPFKIARRYLFAKKSTNAINIISGISVFGITVGAAALIIILSVFNGFGELLGSLFDRFNPDVRITASEGKVFTPTTAQLTQLRALESVEYCSETLEENAMFEYGKNTDFGIIKGVDEWFDEVTALDTMVRLGRYSLQESGRDYAILGLGMQQKLDINMSDLINSISVYMPKRKVKSSLMEQPFKKRIINFGGSFLVQQSDFDEQYVIVPMDFARELLSYTNEVSALEVKLRPEADAPGSIAEIRGIMGEGFDIKDRYQQNAAFFKIMNIEKWIAYVILSFTLVLVAFNMVGSLWMLVIDKKQDIAILKSMGATAKMIRNIFLSEGLLLSLLGVGIGFAIAILACLAQQYFGFITLQGGDAFLIDAYPVKMHLWDFVVVFITVVAIGTFAALLPAVRASRIQAIIRGE